MGSPPIVTVVGLKDSGKTTVAVALVAELRRREKRVMVLKHGHRFDLDHPGTDSWRFREEGRAERVMVAGPSNYALMGDWGPGDELSLSELVARYLSEADIVVAEGYKSAAVAKIEVHRPAAHPEPLYRRGSEDAAHYLAIVTDASELEADVPVLDINSADLASELADLVERQVLGILPGD
jgi:molybdopterin-guanine dinucleotide biosynthesis protein MobB